jgi:hypothetical protein
VADSDNGQAVVNRLAEYEPAEPTAASLVELPQLRTGRRIAIVGKAPDSQHLVPYDDPSWEIWGLGCGAKLMKRWDRWFELHPLEANRERWAKVAPGFWSWLKEDHGKPLYIQDTHPELPHAKSYPLRQYLDKFGSYFTNSISFMLAMAIDEGCAEIGVFGVNMAQSDPVRGQNGEYQHQRPSCEYFIGLAVGAGIKVGIPEESDLCKVGRLYAFDGTNDALRKKWEARKKELHARLAQHEQQAQQHATNAAAIRGAIDDMEYWWQWF